MKFIPVPSQLLLKGIFVCLAPFLSGNNCEAQQATDIFTRNKDTITSSHPTAFQSATNAGIGERQVYDFRVGFVVEDGFLITLKYADAPNVTAWVNLEFGSAATAKIEAEKYGRMIGKIPRVLRQDLGELWLHKDGGAVGGNNPQGTLPGHIVIHTQVAEPDIIYGNFEETLLHEAAHVSLAHLETSPVWLAAAAADGKTVTRYAGRNVAEDVAETVGAWFTIRHRGELIDAVTTRNILRAIPNRLKVLDALLLDMSPFPGNAILDTNNLPTPIRTSSETLQVNRPPNVKLWGANVGTGGIGKGNVAYVPTRSGNDYNLFNIPSQQATEMFFRLWSFDDGPQEWRRADYLTNVEPSYSRSALVTPEPGSNLSSSTIKFDWDPPAGGAAQFYDVLVGTDGPGSSNIRSTQTQWGWGNPHTATAYNVPTNTKVYVRLWAYKNEVWEFNDYTYNEVN